MEHQSHKYGMQKSVGDYLTLNICHRYSMQKSLCVLWFIVAFPEATGKKAHSVTMLGRDRDREAHC